MILYLPIILFLLLAPAAHAQQTMTLDLGRDVPWEGGPYAPMPLQVRVSDAPEDAFRDGAIVAWKDGWLEIGGQIMVVLDHAQTAPNPPNFTFRIWPDAKCESPVSGPGAAMPMPSASGYTNPWWVAYIPIYMKVRLHQGDRIFPCLYASTNNPDGATTNYIDGNPAHTRLHVTLH